MHDALAALHPRSWDSVSGTIPHFFHLPPPKVPMQLFLVQYPYQSQSNCKNYPHGTFRYSLQRGKLRQNWYPRDGENTLWSTKLGMNSRLLSRSRPIPISRTWPETLNAYRGGNWLDGSTQVCVCVCLSGVSGLHGLRTSQQYLVIFGWLGLTGAVLHAFHRLSRGPLRCGCRYWVLLAHQFKLRGLRLGSLPCRVSNALNIPVRLALCLLSSGLLV
jgi:hypothetical protein